MNSESVPLNPAELRRRAEELARERASAPIAAALSMDDMRRIIHELEVHQIQLEMQNESLRKTQSALESVRARYFNLYDLAPVGYVTLDAEGRFLQVNLTMAHLLGEVRERMLKQPLAKYVHPDDQDGCYLLRQRLFERSNLSSTAGMSGHNSPGNEPVSGELRLRAGDGHHFWARWEASLSCEEDGTRTCLVVVSDISDRKQLEADRLSAEYQRNQSQKLESLGVLAGGIAHDFNNLMGGIYGYIELAMGEATNANCAEYLSKAISTIDRAQSLTRQLLTFSKGGDPIRSVTSIKSFIQETALFALSGSNVSCRFNIPDTILPCSIDKNQISQVIDNMVINALQAMPEGGTIDLYADNIRVHDHSHPSLPDGIYVRFTIQDCGTGISAEVLPRIFDPFFTTKSMGHGLGLPTCYSIVKRHGGTIDVETDVGRGTRFHVYLPAVGECAMMGWRGAGMDIRTVFPGGAAGGGR